MHRFGEDTPPLLDEVLAELRALRDTFNEAQRASGLLFPSTYSPCAVLICGGPHGHAHTGARLYGVDAVATTSCGNGTCSPFICASTPRRRYSTGLRSFSFALSISE